MAIAGRSAGAVALCPTTDAEGVPILDSDGVPMLDSDGNYILDGEFVSIVWVGKTAFTEAVD